MSFHASHRRTFLRHLAVASLGLSGLASQAAGVSERPIKIVVPFAPGAGTDAMGRLVAAKLAELLKTTVVVENRVGASGALGAQAVAQSAPDGHTLLLAAAPFTTVPAALPGAGYDPLADFAPVGMIAQGPLVWAANNRLPANTLQELVALARQRPGALNYGSAGVGGINHLVLESLKARTGTFITHIPYRGAGPALQGLIAGDVEMMFDGLGSSASHIAGGRIKALMVSGNKRNPAIPDVPSAAEVGLPDYNVTTWYGVWGPKGMPADAQARAIEEIRKACTTDEAKAVWARQGAEFTGLAGPQFGSFISAEVKKWAQVVKASGAKLD